MTINFVILLCMGPGLEPNALSSATESTASLQVEWAWLVLCPDPTLSQWKQSGEPSQFLGWWALLWLADVQNCHTHKKGVQMYTQERQNVTAARKVLLTQGKYYDCNKLIIVRSYWSLPHFRNVSKSLTNSTFFCSPDHFSPGGACGLGTRLTFCLQFPCTKYRVVHHWLTHVHIRVGVWQQGHPLHTHPL